MLIGIVGAPNKGKSTLFSALTMNEVAIADYPFTTIKPNLGIAYATRKCVHEELGVKCHARNSLCANGYRMLPVNIVDVAGLVEGAHIGKGMGNQFLNDLAGADALIIVVDASGKTDAGGNAADHAEPSRDVEMVKGEIAEWLSSIIVRNMGTISKSADGAQALAVALASLKVSKQAIEKAALSSGLATGKVDWQEDSAKKFARNLLGVAKPYLIAANKSDAKGASENVASLKASFGESAVVPCSAAIELALRKAAKQGMIEYTPGSNSFKDLGKASGEQAAALGYMGKFLEKSGTNAQEVINRAVFNLLDNIVVYPVEDENKYTDHSGNVLPDAILMRKGSTALQLAETIHTNIAKGMLYAIDARSKMRLAKDYILKNNDIIKIVSAAK